MNDPVYTLASIKHHLRLSEETNAFDAYLYAGTKRIALVRNTGNGGDTEIQQLQGCGADVDAFEAWARSLPAIDYPADARLSLPAFSVPMDARHWCDERVTDSLYLKDAQRLWKCMVYVDAKGRIQRTTKPVPDEATRQKWLASPAPTGFRRVQSIEELVALLRAQ